MPSLGACIAAVVLLARYLSVGMKTVDPAGARTILKYGLPVGALFFILSFIRAADWKDNLRLFRSGVEVNPASSRTQYSLASELFRQAQRMPEGLRRDSFLRESGDCFRKSIEILPENFQARYNFALFSSYAGDTAAAIDQYLNILRLKPDYLEAINNLGVLYNARRDFRNAYVYYRKAYDLNPDALLAKSNLSGMLFNQGLDFSRRGFPDSAIASYRQALRFDPASVMACNNIASIHAGNARYDSCLFYLKKAHAVESENLMVLENIGAVSYLNREYDQGVKYAELALRQNPRSQKSLNTMINCYTAKGQPAEAERYRTRLKEVSAGK
jgi:tetratricopeptide (TPR) repeat protein